ncbi:MAG: cytochrome C oxidase subunit IV family protein [Chloroflexi bacterium]|nr:cytochrome C oxidase subunit IV family protein [Chloroflexota bacterium]
MQTTRPRVPARLGLWVFLGLAVLTVVEYIVAVALPGGTVPYLTVIGLLKAGLILVYFMHVAQLWHQEEHDHE